jgi:hypothetical protein
MFVTALTFHAPNIWWKELAPQNMFVTALTSHVTNGWLKAKATANMLWMSVTALTFHTPQRLVEGESAIEHV